MNRSRFIDKLNKVDGNVYVIEELVQITDGVYEGELQHDNVNTATFAVYTGPKLTGNRIESYVLSTPSMTPWKKVVRVYADVPEVYLSYETEGDTVEAEDVNRVQDAVVETQDALNAEEERAAAAEAGLAQRLAAEEERAQNAETVLTDQLSDEITRAKAAEKANSDAVAAETGRAEAKESEIQGNIDAHKAEVDGEIQSLKAADTSLDEKKADAADVNRELGDRYTKSQVFTKEEVLQKIEDLIGTAPDTLDTFKEIADALGNDPNFAATIMNALASKVDKVTGKQLTSNDYSDSEKAMVADVNDKKHIHENKPVIDKITLAMLNKLAAFSGNISDLTGTLPIANGGTGATTAAAALSELGAAAVSHNHDSIYLKKGAVTWNDLKGGA